MTDDESDLRALLGRIEAAWRENRPEELRGAFHPHMQIVGTDDAVYADGVDACVESYREFATNARILDYTATEPSVRVWDDTAVCLYAWTMRWQRDGDVQSDAGSDQFVFTRSNGLWLAVYRMLRFGAAA